MRDEAHFASESAQKETMRLLKAESLSELIKSIKSNGFLPIERIVVSPHGEDGFYLVIEGNRRVAALKMIQRQKISRVDRPS